MILSIKFMKSKIKQKMKSILSSGNIRIGTYQLSYAIKKVKSSPKIFPKPKSPEDSYKLHIGPGSGWKKPNEQWITLDIDNTRADVIIDFNDLDKLPFENESVSSIYGSHVFEHISIYQIPIWFEEFYRIMMSGSYFRFVLPDARKSIENYLSGNMEFNLFKRRALKAKNLYNLDYTIFECMKEDFLSRSGQSELLSNHSLAHQNAWDFETITRQLCRAGFAENNIQRLNFRETNCRDFEFEGTYPSEANEYDRSLYVEVIK